MFQASNTEVSNTGSQIMTSLRMSRDMIMPVISAFILVLTVAAGTIEVKRESDNPRCHDSVAKYWACELLALADDKTIVLWKKHPSGVYDNAFAYNNIRDTCYGYAAARSKYTCKECPSPGAPGGYVCLSPTLVKYIYKVYEELRFIWVNEIAGACHSCKSKHYIGRAVDLHSTSPYQSSIMLEICTNMNGWGLDEKTHIHCQFNT